MNTSVEATVECWLCEELLTQEEASSPERDEHGNAICDECWSEEFRAACQRCGNWWNKSEMSSTPGSIICLFRSADGSAGRLCRGYYRVLSWPFFMDGMIEGYFINDALERVAPPDAQSRRVGAESESAAAPLCPECTVAVVPRS